MKTLATITAAILLTACGGESSSSSEQESTAQPVKVKATYEKALESCGDNLEIAFDDMLINANSENIKAKPIDETATANISGGTNDVCINGNIELLEVSGSSNDIYINGNVKTLTISGGTNDVYIFGNITTLDIEGNSNDIYTEQVTIYELTGSKNDVMKISNAEL